MRRRLVQEQRQQPQQLAVALHGSIVGEPAARPAELVSQMVGCSGRNTRSSAAALLVQWHANGTHCQSSRELGHIALNSLQHAARLDGAQPKASTERCNANQCKGGAAATSGACLKSGQVDMGG